MLTKFAYRKRSFNPRVASAYALVLISANILPLVSACKQAGKLETPDNVTSNLALTKEEKEERLQALTFYVYAGAREFADEHQRYPDSLKELDEEGLLLKKPYNLYKKRFIPLDGSKRDTGDVWLQTPNDPKLIIHTGFSDRIRRTNIMNLPRPGVVNEGNPDYIRSDAVLIKMYYKSKLRRRLLYRANIIRRAFEASKARNLEEFKASPLFPDLDYIRNLVTGEKLRGKEAPGEMVFVEEDRKVYLKCYDEKGKLLPNPEKSFGEALFGDNYALFREPILLSPEKRERKLRGERAAGEDGTSHSQANDTQ